MISKIHALVCFSPVFLLCFMHHSAHADPLSTTSDSKYVETTPDASSEVDNEHVLGSAGVVGTIASNNVQGTSGGLGAQLKLRNMGRSDQMLYDARFSSTAVVSGGQSGPAFTTTGRGEAMIAGTTNDISDSCGVYLGGSAVGRLTLGTTHNGAANGGRFFIGSETGLACDVRGIMLHLAPTVGFGAATNTSTSLSSGPTAGGTSAMYGGALRLGYLDLLNLSTRLQSTIPGAVISGGPTANTTLVGVDADIRVSDALAVGVTYDSVAYAVDPTAPAPVAGSANVTSEKILTGGVFGTF